MKNTTKGTGIAALIGLGLGALAFFGYKRLPQDKKDQLKGRFNEAGNKIKDTARDVENTVKEKYDSVKGNVKDDYRTAKSNVKDELRDARQ